MFSLVVPVFRNEENIPALVAACAGLSKELGGAFEAVFVVDGSPDRSAEALARALDGKPFRAQLVVLSRNFGAFAAVRCGLGVARGERFGVMAADLQEPPELLLDFARRLEQDACDVVVGTREGRDDPWVTRASAGLFWWVYRRLVQPQMPRGGVDVFACNRLFRDRLLELPELNSTLVGLLVWMGFRRQEVPYQRRARAAGVSAWTFRKKLRYLFDSMYAFSDLPFQLLLAFGAGSMVLTIGLGAAVLVGRVAGWITVEGYTPIVLLLLFFGSLHCLSFGVLGGYLFRTFENTKGRPPFLVQMQRSYDPEPKS